MSIDIHRAPGACSHHSAPARCTAAVAMALLSAPTWAAPLGLSNPWPPAHQLMLVAYVIVAAALAGVLLGMLRRSMRRSSSPRRSGRSARRPQGLGVAGAGWPNHRSTANVRSDFGADSGLPTEPAAWGYKLDDFAILPPTDDEEAEHVAQVVDHVVDQAEDAGTAATRQPVQRPRVRRTKPLRRPTSPTLGPTTA